VNGRRSWLLELHTFCKVVCTQKVGYTFSTISQSCVNGFGSNKKQRLGDTQEQLLVASEDTTIVLGLSVLLLVVKVNCVKSCVEKT
jgi:hypothetical protein